MINIATDYLNPDEFARGIVRPQIRPDRWQQFIAGTIHLYTDIPLRERSDEPNDQPEALTVISIECDGRNPARLIARPPAPQPGDPAHIVAFHERIIRLYGKRF